MTAENNLFLYNFAVVSLMKNTSAHVKEWLDYHLLAGADHFYIYDNDSLDNLKEILNPYVNAGIVTYIFYPGKNKKIVAYNDAVQNFKFECRYMAFVDCEEFIFPRQNQSLVEVADEILGDKEEVGGFELHRFAYTSPSKAADDEGGLLDNFKRRGRKPVEVTNTIVNPRKVDFLFNTRYATYFDGVFRINEYSGKIGSDEGSTVTEKIVINSYKKIDDKPKDDSKPADTSKFILSSFYRSNIFDDGIVIYRDSRRETLPADSDIIETFGGKVDDAKLLAALAKALLPKFDEEDAVEFFKTPENQLKYFREMGEFFVNAPEEFFENKMATFLTGFNLALRLQKNLLDETAGRFFVDATLNALCQTLATEFSSADAQLLLRELPKILVLPYATVETLMSICVGMIEQMKAVLQLSSDEKKNFDIDEGEMETWRKITELGNLEKLLKTFKFENKE